MPEGTVTIYLNGIAVAVQSGSTVAATLLNAGLTCRRSVTGEARTALCGMGVCFECRAVVDGRAHRRTCQVMVRNGMVVETEQ